MYGNPLAGPEKISPPAALAILIEGNRRFTGNLTTNRDLLGIASTLREHQQPFAAVLGCSDSRTTAELIFDQTLGDVFSVRLAGNIASRTAIGSLEFACQHLGSKLVVVLGHSGCGAVKACCDRFTGGNIGQITRMIAPAVDCETTTTTDRSSANTAFVDRVCELNVGVQLGTILTQSEILQEMLGRGEIGFAGGIYNLATTGVVFPDRYRIFGTDQRLAFDQCGLQA